MNLIDTNEPSKQLFGVKITDKRKTVYLFDKAKKSFWETHDKNECLSMVEKIGNALKAKNHDDIFLFQGSSAYAIEVTSLITAEAGKKV